MLSHGWGHCIRGYCCFKTEEVSNSNTGLHSDTCWNMYFAASCIIEFVGKNAFKKLYYYSSLNFSIPKVYSLIVLLTCQWLPVDTLVQVTQSYQAYHGRMCLCAFGTHGHWKSLPGPCRLWKPLGLSAAPHPFFWLSHSGQLCLTLGLEEH